MSCQGILSSIASSPEWSWADNDGILAPLKSRRSDLEANTLDFAHEFFMSEAPLLRKKYEASKFLALCQKLSLDLDNRIDKLEFECKLLVSMHQSRGLIAASPAKLPRSSKS